MNGDYPDYRQDRMRLGELYQDFIERVFLKRLGIDFLCYKSKIEQYLIGENKAGIEIKHDRKFRQRVPPALWIEYAEKAFPRVGDYAPAGILRNDNAWLLVIGDYKTVFIFGINTLRRFHERNLERRFFILVESPTSKGFLLPIEDAYKYAEKVIEIDASFADEEEEFGGLKEIA